MCCLMGGHFGHGFALGDIVSHQDEAGNSHVPGDSCGSADIFGNFGADQNDGDL